MQNESGAVAPANVTTRYEYHALGDTLVLTGALGGLLRSEYNTSGWLTRQVDQTNRATTFACDGLGRRVKVVAQYKYKRGESVRLRAGGF